MAEHHLEFYETTFYRTMIDVLALRAIAMKVHSFAAILVVLAVTPLAPRQAFSQTSPQGISGKLSGLTATERKSVVLCTRGTISKNYRETVAHNLQTAGEDTLWALKVTGLESFQMFELAKAANWEDMEAYYNTESDNIQKLIRGQVTFDSYWADSKENSQNLQRILEPEMSNKAEHKKNFQKFASLCEEISSTIISKSKVVSSR